MYLSTTNLFSQLLTIRKCYLTLNGAYFMRFIHMLNRTVVFFGLIFMILPAEAASTAKTERLNFIQQSFNKTEQNSRLWQNGWFSIFTGVTVLNGIAYTQTEGSHNRYDRATGFTTSLLGAADMLLNPMQTHNYAGQLAAMPDDNEEQQQAKLLQAEAWLSAAASRERYERSFTSHALSTLVNGLAGLAVAYDDKSPDDGWMTFISGVIASEVKIYTAPTQMMQAEEDYNNGNYRQAAANSAAQRWQVAAFGPVLAVQYRF